MPAAIRKRLEEVERRMRRSQGINVSIKLETRKPDG